MYPVYALRQYFKIFDEGPYKVVDTYTGRYILDYLIMDPLRTSFMDRRIFLLANKDTLPYPIYRIRKSAYNWKQLLGLKLLHKVRNIIDDSGNILSLKSGRNGKLIPLVIAPVVEVIDKGGTFQHIIKWEGNFYIGVYPTIKPYFCLAKLSKTIFSPLFGCNEDSIKKRYFRL